MKAVRESAESATHLGQMRPEAAWSSAARSFTKLTYTWHSKILCIENQRSLDFHIDHVFSIKAGFLADISPKVIGSLANLQMLPAAINRKKQDSCWISQFELQILYDQLSSEDRFDHLTEDCRLL